MDIKITEKQRKKVIKKNYIKDCVNEMKDGYLDLAYDHGVSREEERIGYSDLDFLFQNIVDNNEVKYLCLSNNNIKESSRIN